MATVLDKCGIGQEQKEFHHSHHPGPGRNQYEGVRSVFERSSPVVAHSQVHSQLPPPPPPTSTSTWSGSPRDRIGLLPLLEQESPSTFVLQHKNTDPYYRNNQHLTPDMSAAANQEAKNRFSSTKALFQSLERQNSPVEHQVQSVNGGTAEVLAGRRSGSLSPNRVDLGSVQRNGGVDFSPSAAPNTYSGLGHQQPGKQQQQTTPTGAPQQSPRTPPPLPPKPLKLITNSSSSSSSALPLASHGGPPPLFTSTSTSSSAIRTNHLDNIHSNTTANHTVPSESTNNSLLYSKPSTSAAETLNSGPVEGLRRSDRLLYSGGVGGSKAMFSGVDSSHHSVENNGHLSGGGSDKEDLPERGDSPLTEMTKRFNDLVSDLESMTSVPPPNRYPHTVKLTQTLHMEGKETEANGGSGLGSLSSNGGGGGGLTKPSSLYQPYWRQHSWYTRRYGLEADDDSTATAGSPRSNPTIPTILPKILPSNSSSTGAPSTATAPSTNNTDRTPSSALSNHPTSSAAIIKTGPDAIRSSVGQQRSTTSNESSINEFREGIQQSKFHHPSAAASSASSWNSSSASWASSPHPHNSHHQAGIDDDNYYRSGQIQSQQQNQQQQQHNNLHNVSSGISSSTTTTTKTITTGMIDNNIASIPTTTATSSAPPSTSLHNYAPGPSSTTQPLASSASTAPTPQDVHANKAGVVGGMSNGGGGISAAAHGNSSSNNNNNGAATTYGLFRTSKTPTPPQTTLERIRKEAAVSSVSSSSPSPPPPTPPSAAVSTCGTQQQHPTSGAPGVLGGDRHHNQPPAGPYHNQQQQQQRQSSSPTLTTNADRNARISSTSANYHPSAVGPTSAALPTAAAAAATAAAPSISNPSPTSIAASGNSRFPSSASNNPHFNGGLPHHEQQDDVVELMTEEEQTILLSTSAKSTVGCIVPADEASKRLSTASHSSSTSHLSLDRDGQGVHWLSDGHFWMEVEGLGGVDEEDPIPPHVPVHAHSRVSFSSKPIKVYSTHSETEYDRRNSDIDPISASAEYELERRLEKMDLVDVTVHKGNEGLGFSIIGMGVGADAGLEKLGIFVKSIASGGAVHKNGKIQVCDQIVEVDGQSLVGVTQTYAATVLRTTSGTVRFRIGREKNLEGSEIGMLIGQSLEQDRAREEHQQHKEQHLHRQQERQDSQRTTHPADVEEEAESGGSRTGVWNSSSEGDSSTPVPNTPSDTTPHQPTTPTELFNHNHQQIQDLMTQLKQTQSDNDEEEEVDEEEEEEEEHGDGDGDEREMDDANDETSGLHQDSADSDDGSDDAAEEEQAEEAAAAADHTSRRSLQKEQDSADNGDKDNSNAPDQFPPPSALPPKASSSAFQSEEKNSRGGRLGVGEESGGVLSAEMSALVQDSLLNPPSATTSYSSSLLQFNTSSVLAQNPAALNGELEIKEGIRVLEDELKSIREQASQYQVLLNQSQSHCSDLEHKYIKAKQMLKDYQEREKDLLEREEAHLSKLKQKDQEYASVMDEMKSKIQKLESELREQQAKRTSLVEAQLGHLQEQLKKEVEKGSVAATNNGGGNNVGNSNINAVGRVNVAELAGGVGQDRRQMSSSSATTDISPALAYQPTKPKLPQAHQTSVGQHSTTVQVLHGSEQMGIPSTTLLDSSMLKSKAEAVKQSSMMCSRMLPSNKGGEIEVHDICHHTEAHAHILRLPYNPDEGDGGVGGTGMGGGVTSPSHSSTSTPPSINVPSPATPRRHTPLPTIFKRHTSNQPKDGNIREVEIVHALDVLHWTCDEVCGFLKALGLEKYIPEFTVNKVDGGKFLQLDGTRLKAMGVMNHNDRSLIKKRVKEMKSRIERERKAIEKESRNLAKRSSKRR